MNMPSKNENTAVLDRPIAGDYGMTPHHLNFTFLANKPRKANFSVGKPVAAGYGKSLDKLSSNENWYAEVPAKADDVSSKCKKIGVEIEDLMQWVRIIAQKIIRPLPSNVMLNDLVQDGMLGLITALREYDASLGVPFHAFAKNKIRWAIMDGLRAGDWADNHVRGRANKVAKTTEQLRAVLHRKPSNGEIADALGVRVDDITTILGDAHGYNFVRLGDGIEDGVHDIPDSRMEPSVIVERREAYSRAVTSLKVLASSERRAFVLRIMCDMSGQQAATEMGVSESRVSQLYKTATAKLASCV